MISLIRLPLIFFIVISPFLSLYSETLNMDFTSPASPNNLQVSNDGQKILSTVGDYSAWYSSDGGEGWESFNSKLAGVNNVVYQYLYPYMVGPDGDKIVVFCTINSSDTVHVLYSDDGGNNFVDRTPAIWEDVARNACFAVDALSNDTWLIQTRNLCYYTFDAGEHWNCVQNIPEDNGLMFPEVILSDPVAINTYYSIASYGTFESGTYLSNSKIFRSQNGPYYWETQTPFIELNSQLGTYQSETSNFLPLSNGNFLAYVRAKSETDDWTIDRFVTFNSDGEFLYRSGGDINLRNVLFEDHEIPGRLYMNSTSNLFVSNDYGQSWETISSDSFPSDTTLRFRGFYQDSNGSSLYCSIAEYGIYQSTDHGTTWSSVNTFVLPRFKQLYAQDEDIIYSGIGDYWLRRPSGTDDLLTITITGHPDTTYSLGKIGYSNEDTLIGIAYVYPYSEIIPHLRLLGTFDGGVSWPLMYDIGEQYYMDNFYFFESLSCSGNHFITFQNDYIKHSNDFGMNWETLPTIMIGNTPAHKSLMAHHNDQLYVHTNGGNPYLNEIFKYDFINETWINTTFESSRSMVLSMAVNSYSLVVIQSDGTVLRCAGNTSWSLLQPITLPTPYSEITTGYIDCDDPFLLYGIRHCNELYVLKDYSYELYPVELEYPYGLTVNEIRSINHDPVRERIWLETNYGLFWFPVEYVLSVQDKPVKVQPADFNLFTAYPNPFNASTRIQYHLEKPGNVKLDVYDITGRLVQTLKYDYQSAGIQNVFLDGSKLASGTYFIRLNTNNEIRNRKITLIK